MALVTVVASGAVAQEAEPPSLNWLQGPMDAPVGSSLAQINIDENYMYLDEGETKRFMEMNENPLSNTEKATVAPITGEWFLVFEFEDSGYVSDDQKGDLDAGSLLEAIQAGNEAGNEERRKRGWPEYHVVGWQEEPNYDERTNNLSWTIVGESEGRQNINRIIKLLGRRGVMTATLVAAPERLAAASPAVDALIDDFEYLPGNTYAEYVPGKDKLAEYGLAALVVGGAGAALLKSGLLAKLWKPIAVGLAALGAGIKRLFFSGRSAQHDSEKPIG